MSDHRVLPTRLQQWRLDGSWGHDVQHDAGPSPVGRWCIATSPPGERSLGCRIRRHRTGGIGGITGTGLVTGQAALNDVHRNPGLARGGVRADDHGRWAVAVRQERTHPLVQCDAAEVVDRHQSTACRASQTCQPGPRDKTIDRPVRLRLDCAKCSRPGQPRQLTQVACRGRPTVVRNASTAAVRSSAVDSVSALQRL